MNKKRKAVTLIETLITLLAISIMIAGPVTFTVRSISFSQFVRGKVVATGLAQEGVELATALRNGSTDAVFTSAIAPCLNTACSVDFSFDQNDTTGTANISFAACSGAGCGLYRNTAEVDSLWRQSLSYTGGTDYSRSVTFVPNANGSYTVKSRVWKEQSGNSLPVDVTMEKTIFLFNKQ
jgi:Tfp pilus assembly protein FimT